MNWLILVSDAVFMLAAAILGVIGLSTLRAIRHLDIGKSFWVPVFLSGALFLIGSGAKTFHDVAIELDLSLTINTDQIVHFSSLLALCILMSGIYNYSRNVKTETRTHYYEVDNKSQSRLYVHPQKEEKKKKARHYVEKGIPVCPHHLGYLAEIPEDASIPEECLTCPQMLECKNASILRTR